MHRFSGLPSGFSSLPRWWAPPCSPPSAGRPSLLLARTASSAPHLASARITCSFSGKSPSLQQPSSPYLLSDIIATSPSIFLLSNIFFLCVFIPPEFLRGLNLRGNQQGSGPTANFCIKQDIVPSISSEAIHDTRKEDGRHETPIRRLSPGWAWRAQRSALKGDPAASRSPPRVLSALPGAATGSPHVRLNPGHGQQTRGSLQGVSTNAVTKPRWVCGELPPLP